MTQTPAEQPSRASNDGSTASSTASTTASTKDRVDGETASVDGETAAEGITASTDRHLAPGPAESPTSAGDPAPSTGDTAAAEPRSDITAEALSPRQIRINGEPHTVTEGENPYRQVYAQAHQHAQQTGTPAVVHGIDHVRGEQSWFSMSPEGEVAAHAQPGNGRAPAAPLAEAPGKPPAQPEPPTQATPPMQATPPAQTAPVAQQPGPSAKPQPGAQTGPAGPADPARATGSVPANPTSLDPAAQQTRAERRRIAEAGRPFVAVAAEKPQGGFRRFLYDATGGAINIGPSQKELRERELIERIARPLQGSHNTAVLSLKGGIGKTSTHGGCRHDPGPPPRRHSLRHRRESGFRGSGGARPGRARDPGAPAAEHHRSAQEARRRGLADRTAGLPAAGRAAACARREQDPALSDSLTAEEWRRIHAEFAKYYSVIVTDCGTGVTHNAMKGILHTADNIVIAAGFAVSGAQRALQMLNWLANHGYERLARESIVVITDKERVSDRVDKQAIQESLRGYCGKLVVVPFDRAVVDGDRIHLDMLQEETRRAYMDIAAAMVDGHK